MAKKFLRAALALTAEDFLLRVADEPEARAAVVVGLDVDVRLVAIVPEHHRFIHLTRNGQRYAAIALASRRCFEFRNPLFEIGAAVATEIGGLGPYATCDYTGRGDEREAAGRLKKSPDLCRCVWPRA